MSSRQFLVLLGAIGVLAAATGLNPTEAFAAAPRDVEQWGVFELMLEGSAGGTPYTEVRLSAVFQKEGKTVAVPGFYDGGGKYFIRFSPGSQGRWTYTTRGNRPELDGKKGSFNCVAPSPENHGPVRVVNTFYLQYADGSPYYAVGTTAYQWTSVDQEIQEETLKTLAQSPFNKIRMCFFPKWYRYGNDTEPWAYPFERRDGQNDFTRPNYEFFRSFDRRVRQLRDMGIQADVILFHPYDHWGYEKMGRENDDRCLRTMIARLSAYRNVWWSMANEFDLMIQDKVKSLADFDRFFQICQKEDPHQRLRGIHNWHGTEDHFYNHTKPWVTHASLQTSNFWQAIAWRHRYQKPVLFDEMRYEGDVASSWGNMSAEEMTSYFWMCGLSGAYGTHGDTYESRPGVRWWGKGGRLVGQSPPRIAFFRKVMEQAPVTQMVPSMIATGQPDSRADNIYIFAQPGRYYLAYAANAGKTISLDLPGDSPYKAERIDTWNMTIQELPDAAPGPFSYRAAAKYQALRLFRKEN